jgi:hypothetical protein
VRERRFTGVRRGARLIFQFCHDEAAWIHGDILTR